MLILPSTPEPESNRQREIYKFIHSKIASRGYGPTVREIGEAFDIKSPNGVMCHLKALEKKGLIKRTPNAARVIEVLGGPPNERSERRRVLVLEEENDRLRGQLANLEIAKLEERAAAAEQRAAAERQARLVAEERAARQEEEIAALEAEKQTDKRYCSDHYFCPKCDKPHVVWDAQGCRCFSCGWARLDELP
jgi:SOS-response transcriptional repressor LexA